MLAQLTSFRECGAIGLGAAGGLQLGAGLLFLLTMGILLIKRKWITGSLDLDVLPGPWRQGWPIIGNLTSLWSLSVHRQLLAWADEFGGIYRASLFGQEGVIVSEPAMVAAVVGRGPGSLDKAALNYHSINEMTSAASHANLLTSPSDSTWHAIRKAVAQSFSFNNVKRKVPAILERVDMMISKLHDLGPEAAVDMDQMALRVTVDIIGLAGFGHNYNAVEQPMPAPPGHLLRILPRCFLECMLRIANPFRSRLPWLAPLSQPGFFGWAAKGARSFSDFQHEMQQLLKEVCARGATADDLDIGTQLCRLMQSGKVSEARILSEIGILFVEGFETTGHTISWTLLHIAETPGVQEKVAAELESIGLLRKASCASPSKSVELEDLKHLKYLTACVKEAMRMNPVVSIMSRITQEPTKVGPYQIPKGTAVVIPLFVIHNSRHNWDTPDEFRPERWLAIPVETYVASPDMFGGSNHAGGNDAPAGSTLVSAGSHTSSTESSVNEEAKQISYMPFSDGPRNCVGQTLAKLEVMLVLTSILSHFRISLTQEMGGLAGVRQRESTLLTLQPGPLGIQFHMHPW